MTFNEKMNTLADCLGPFDYLIIVILVSAIILATTASIVFGIAHLFYTIRKYRESRLSDGDKAIRYAKNKERAKKYQEIKLKWKTFWHKHHLILKTIQFAGLAILGYFVVSAFINGVSCYIQQ